MKRLVGSRVVQIAVVLVCVLTMCLTGLVAGAKAGHASGQQPAASQHELTFAYWSWHNAQSNTALSDLAAVADVVIIYPGDGEAPASFWKGLPDQIAELHKLGTKVLFSLDGRVLFRDTFPENKWEAKVLKKMELTPTGYAERAKEIREGLLNFPGLDGIVIDRESMTGNEPDQAFEVTSELAHYYGQYGPKGTILGYHSKAVDDLFRRIHHMVTYALVDSYSRKTADLQKAWEGFASYIHPYQLVLGINYNDDQHNTSESFEKSHAYTEATWEPNGGQARKGGIFSYDVNRTEASTGQVNLKPSAIDWLKKLAQVVNPLGKAKTAPKTEVVKPATKPTTQPATKPVATPAVKPAPQSPSVAPATKPVSQPSPRPAAQVRPALSRPVAKGRVPGHLAKTGSDAGVVLDAGLAAAVLGLALLVVRRQSRRV